MTLSASLESQLQVIALARTRSAALGIDLNYYDAARELGASPELAEELADSITFAP